MKNQYSTKRSHYLKSWRIGNISERIVWAINLKIIIQNQNKDCLISSEKTKKTVSRLCKKDQPCPRNLRNDLSKIMHDQKISCYKKRGKRNSSNPFSLNIYDESINSTSGGYAQKHMMKLLSNKSIDNSEPLMTQKSWKKKLFKKNGKYTGNNVEVKPGNKLKMYLNPIS